MLITDEILQKYYGLSSFKRQDYELYSCISTSDDIFFLYQVDTFFRINTCYELSLYVDYTNPFIFNSFSNIITVVNDNLYVLIHLSKEKINKIPIFSFYPLNKKIEFNWREKWIQRCDYYNSLYKTIKGKFPIIDESIHYCIGFLEMAIFFLKEYNNYYDIAYVQHQFFDEEEYYNPLNLILDVKERDFAEYLKYLFFSKQYLDINVESLIYNGKNVFCFDLVVARLLYPNYYFNVVDDIILGKKNEECLQKIVDRFSEYEQYLKKIVRIMEKEDMIKKHPFF